MAKIDPQDLVFHILNVGHADAILVGFPAATEEERRYGLVDCGNGTKTKGYLNKLFPDPEKRPRLLFICATHPHRDHILGMKSLLTDPKYKPEWFWDSGFRLPSVTYSTILDTIAKDPAIHMIRVSSGMERYFGKVRVTALAPSVRLRNRYATYGIDSNNASIVLRFEYHDKDVLLTESEKYNPEVITREEANRQAGKSVMILSGDAEFDSWAQVVEEFPTQHETEADTEEDTERKAKLLNPLSCWVVKVPHHGSMHSASLDIYEKMGEPSLAIVSNKQRMGKIYIDGQSVIRGKFPHPSTINSLHETETKILTTDGSYEGETVNGVMRDQAHKDPGTVVVAIPRPPSKPKYIKVKDTTKAWYPPDPGTAELTSL